MSKELEAFSKERQALDELYDVAGNIQNLKEDYSLLKQVLTKFDKIKTIMDTWNTSGIMPDEEVLSQIDEVLRNEQRIRMFRQN